MSTETKGMILLVDDTETNIDILMEALADDFEISVAMDGENALEAVEDLNPDLILLDIMMPGIDGYEVCKRLKADKATKDIPIVFLTAMTESEDEAKGLALGAVDYITKPFNPELVKARVKNHMALRLNQVELTDQRDRIEDDYRQIKELEKLRDELVHMMVHDMRTPLMGISSYLSMILAFDQDKLEDETKDYIIESLGAAELLNNMITALLDVSKLESGKMPLNKEKCDFSNIAEQAIKRLGGLLQGKKFEYQKGADIREAICDPVLMERVIANIISNAIKFTPANGRIKLELNSELNWNRITITDNGPGIPQDYHNKIFEKFGQVEARKENKKFSTGLGLTFCKLAVDAHGGSIQVESKPGEGTSFHIRLPIEDIEIKPDRKENGISDEAALTPQESNNIDENQTRLLLVNESRMITESLKRYLEARTDWIIYELNSPASLLNRIKKIAPRIVIMDMEISHLSGPEIAREICNLSLAEKPLIAFFTNMFSPEEYDRHGIIRKTGKHALIPRGMPLSHLLQIIRKIEEERGSQ